MIKISMLICCAFFACAQVMAQYPCHNGISTNPANPINNQLPAKRNTFFNWQDSIWQMQPAPNCFRTGQNESPFFKTDNLEELREAKDMRWEDGWELIRRHVGLTEANAYTASNPEHLYVVLYNKYTAVLRVLLLVCRNTDYNAARVVLKFDATSSMKTDLLELSRGEVTALNKKFIQTEFLSAMPYFNENSKWFYADFPMMYDPCTCLYTSKLNIITRMVSSATIMLEGGITGEIHTQDVGGKAQVQKTGSYAFKNSINNINNKALAVYGGINKFVSETKKLANNLGRVETAGKADALDLLGKALKDSKFLKAGFSGLGWLKSAMSLVDLFSGGGKSTSPGGPQEVKLLPLSVNLTAKLSGTLQEENYYHNITLSNPGSKDAALDPGNYPYYNEVLGVFNLLRQPVMYHQRYVDAITNQGGTVYGVNVFVNKYHFLLDSLKYVLNPAAGVTIQNMQVAMLVEALPNTAGICKESESLRHIPGMVFEGRDILTDAYKFRTDYYDVKCFNEQVFEAVSYFGRSTPNEGIFEAGCWLPQPKAWLKFMINLKRNNAGPNTQNILYVVTYPMNLKTYDVQGSFTSNPCADSSIVDAATPAEVNGFCNSTVYFNQDRQNRAYIDSIVEVAKFEKEGIGVFPNPGRGQFTLKLAAQNTHLKGVTITDLRGHTIYRRQYQNQSLKDGLVLPLDVKLANGVYLLQCVTGKGILKTKIAIQE
jgi:hypothetical protein